MNTSLFGLRMIEAFEGFPNGGKPYICPALCAFSLPTT